MFKQAVWNDLALMEQMCTIGALYLVGFRRDEESYMGVRNVRLVNTDRSFVCQQMLSSSQTILAQELLSICWQHKGKICVHQAHIAHTHVVWCASAP